MEERKGPLRYHGRRLFGQRPVSYTHLDVYKRQHISCLPAVYEAGEYYEKFKDVIENENGIEKYQ